MSQPTESPARGNWAESLDRLGELSPQGWENLATIAQLQQTDFDRLIRNAQKVPLKDRLNDKVHAATARVHAVYSQTSHRLSTRAQELATQAGQYVQAGREWGDQQVTRATEFGGRQVTRAVEFTDRQIDRADRQIDRAIEFGDRQIDRAAAFTDRQVDRALEFGQQAAGTYQAGVEAAGKGIKAGREWSGQQVTQAAEFGGRQVDRAAELGGKAMAAGKGAVDRASRWIETQKTRVSVAAEGARATIAAARFDKNMPGATPKDLTQLSQQHSRIMSGPTLESRLEAAQNVAQQLQKQVEAQATHAALGGMAPAGKAVNQSQPTQTQQTTEQTANSNLQKNTDNKGIGSR
ncbi:hypothetical protein ACWF0M_34390 [Kribbella sp. NPDC055110]